ncbi:MAG TPA: DUF3301 domain-containing protein [Gammaproteobacteria bacterium]|nr:DUF3301 domain-containing protein [Gammaproteobacteria bacterium]
MPALVALGIWNDSMRAREAANRIAIDACERRYLQFLDGTVSLAKLRPRIDKGGLHIERTYVFDYAIEGTERATGFVIMLGYEVRHVGF